jgi:phosphotransferase system  glucose/maltose/N-acetylglucosamine-specific IIC component
MTRKIFLAIFLLTGIVVGLGALGHTLAASQVHAAIDKFAMDPGLREMIYVVWYMTSGCMLLFGIAIVWAWANARRGDAKPLFVAVLIGILYSVAGVSGMIYRHGHPFMLLFIVLGGLLLICSFVLTRVAQA